MSRYRLLDPPHKGIRNLLGQWALASGNTDPATPAEVDELKALTRLVDTLLRDHGRNEDEFVFPLLDARRPGGSEALHADHEALDDALAAVVASIQALGAGATPEDMHAIHLRVTEFQATYLLHMIREEEELEPALWGLYTDEELLAAEAAVAQSLDPALLLDWFRVCAPARTIAEDVIVLRNIATVVPPEAFAGVLAAVADVMPATRMAAISSALGSDHST